MNFEQPIARLPVPANAGSHEERRWAAWAGGAVVGGLTLLAFLPALRNGFVNFDDVENFLGNPHYRGLGWSNVR